MSKKTDLIQAIWKLQNASGLFIVIRSDSGKSVMKLKPEYFERLKKQLSKKEQ